MPFSRLERCRTSALKHTNTHIRKLLRSSSSLLHLSAPCCQGARQEVMFVPSGTVIFSFSPLLAHVSYPLLPFSSPPPPFPLIPVFVWHLTFKALPPKIIAWTDSSGQIACLCVCLWRESRHEYDKALCQRGCTRDCVNANDHIWRHCYLAFISAPFFSLSLIQLAKALLANYISLRTAVDNQ